MKVRATQLGYYDHARRRVGDVFTIRTEAEFSARWMTRVPDATPERRTSAQQALDQACADSALGVRARIHAVPEVVDTEPQHAADFDPYETPH